MRLRTTIKVDVDAEGDTELEERVLDIAQQEAMRYSAAMADRLEAEGLTDVEIELEGDE
jgi:hypothetical protein